MHAKLSKTLLTCNGIAIGSLADMATIPTPIARPTPSDSAAPGAPLQLHYILGAQPAATPDDTIIHLEPKILQQPPQPIWPNPAVPMPPLPTLSQQHTAAPEPEPTKQKKRCTKAKSTNQDTPGPSSTTVTLNPPNEPVKKRG